MNLTARIEKLYREIHSKTSLLTPDEIDKALDPNAPDWDKILALVAARKLVVMLERKQHEIPTVDKL